MGEKALQYARRFMEVHASVMEAVERCSDPQWSSICPDENESVGAVANHIAAAYRLELDLLISSLSGLPAPTIYVAEGALDQYHARASISFSRYTREQTLRHLHDNAEQVNRFLCDLEDASLNKLIDAPMIVKWFGQSFTLEAAVEYLIISHPMGHLNSIQKACE